MPSSAVLYVFTTARNLKLNISYLYEMNGKIQRLVFINMYGIQGASEALPLE